MSIVVDAIALYNIDDRDDYTLALTQKLNELGIKEETNDMIAIIDYGAGNLRSVERLLQL